MSARTTWPAVRALVGAAGLRPAHLVGLAAVSAVQALLVTPAPFLVQRAFEVATTGGTRGRLVALVSGLVALLLFSELVAIGVKAAALRLTKPAILRLRERLATAVAFLPLNHVEQQPATVHDIYVHDTDRMDVMLNAVAAMALPAALLVVLLSAVLVVANPGFGLATSAAAVLVASAERLTRRRIRRRLEAWHRTFADVSRGAWSMLSGFLIIRAHAAERDEVARRRAEAEAAGIASEDALRATAVAAAASRATAAVVFGALLLAAGILVQQDLMSIPAMLAVYATIALLRAPLNTLGLIAPQVQEGWHAWRRVLTLLEATSPDIAGGGVAPAPGASIVLDGVACRHGERVLFEDVSLVIHPGEVVALTGPNGAGKTTLIKQIVGLIPPSRGVIRVGHDDLDRLNPIAWRQSLGVVPQETWLFDGTIRENLTYGAPSATAADVDDACRLARADGVLHRLPDGLDTKIGAGGIRLSDGQRQRLAIARALVRSPRFLILDEPTNHLDQESARTIIAGIVSRPDRPGVLIVTHEPDVASMADRVYLLSEGSLTALPPAAANAVAAGAR